MSGLDHLSTLIAIGATLLYIAAGAAIAHVIQSTRTPQAIVAWCLSLLVLPIVAVPAYAVLGRNRFHGYVLAHRSVSAQTSELVREVRDALYRLAADVPPELEPLFDTVRRLTGMPLVRGNSAEILIDGDQAYAAMLAAIGEARDYVLFQSYIVRDDATGRAFADALIARAQTGVRVHFLYDEIGCVSLPGRYLRRLEAGGVVVSGFKTTRGPGNRFQINFRNHRKILVVDGVSGFVGGMNIGEEHRGRVKRLGRLRDTHLRLAGAAVQMVQIAFVEDWFWAERVLLDLDWQPEPVDDGAAALVLRTGPADEESVCELVHLQAFNSARKRLWLACGYFVPDETIIRALQLAAMRGVDVRVLIPGRAENRLAWLASFNYLPRLVRTGVKVLLYQGVMHQKAFLVDDRLAGVGSANMDSRSLHINFEVTALVVDKAFAAEVERMLLDDFASAVRCDSEVLDRRPYWFRLAARAVNLMAPLL